MTITDAVWEKRNLGITAAEIEIEPGDDAQLLNEKIPAVDAEYIVIKTDSAKTDILFDIHKLGFVYIEDMISFCSNLAVPELNRIQQRLLDSVSAAVMDEADREEMFAEIRKGIFNTDRISVDPFFTAAQAAERYCGWIRDELERGTLFYKYIYKEKTAGFFAVRDTGGGIFTSFIGALYSDYSRTGLGNVLNFRIFEEVKRLGGKQLNINVSSNNAVQVRSVLASGYTVKDIHHIYVKHQ